MASVNNSTLRPRRLGIDAGLQNSDHTPKPRERRYGLDVGDQSPNLRPNENPNDDDSDNKNDTAWERSKRERSPRHSPGKKNGFSPDLGADSPIRRSSDSIWSSPIHSPQMKGRGVGGEGGDAHGSAAWNLGSSSLQSSAQGNIDHAKDDSEEDSEDSEGRVARGGTNHNHRRKEKFKDLNIMMRRNSVKPRCEYPESYRRSALQGRESGSDDDHDGGDDPCDRESRRIAGGRHDRRSSRARGDRRGERRSDQRPDDRSAEEEDVI